MMTSDLAAPAEAPLPVRDARGGRPARAVSARLGSHILDVALQQLASSEADHKAGMEWTLKSLANLLE